MLRHRMKHAYLLAILPLSLVPFACSSIAQVDPAADAAATPTSTADGGPSPIAAQSGLPCDAAKILGDSCTKCQGDQPSYGAPIGLPSYDALAAPAPSDGSKKVYQLVGTRIHDDVRPMPQPPNLRLSAADTATIDAWVAKGAPKSQDTCAAST